MNAIWITVYRDTIEEHNGDDNLSDILVRKDFAEKYFNEVLAFDDWENNYTADDTIDFYQYANAHNAIIKIRH